MNCPKCNGYISWSQCLAEYMLIPSPGGDYICPHCEHFMIYAEWEEEEGRQRWALMIQL